MKTKISILIITLMLAITLLSGCKKEVEDKDSSILPENQEENYIDIEEIEDIPDENEEKDLDIIALDKIIEEDSSILVPAELLAEGLGAEFTWDKIEDTILIQKDENLVEFKIGSKVISYNDGQDYGLSKAIPRISEDQVAYVPLEALTRALKISTIWKEKENNLYIDYEKEDEKEIESNIKIISQKKDDKIRGKTTLQVDVKEDYKNASEIRYILLDKGSTSGFILEKAKDIKKAYDYIPKIEDNGDKILAALIYGPDGEYLDGDIIPIQIEVEPKVSLLGLNENDLIESTATLSTSTNFLPLYVKYEIMEIISTGQGKKTLTSLTDPLDTFTWNPNMGENKKYSIRAVAYDSKENPYYSPATNVVVNKARILSLGGVTENMTISKEVNLMANRNFDVSETEYLMKDLSSGNISTIAKIPYGSYKWNPSPEDSGKKELFVRVLDRGNTYESNPIPVLVDGKARLFLEGIGPNQVINKTTSLNVNTNVNLEDVKYIVRELNTNSKREIISNPVNNEGSFTPLETEKGKMTIQAQAEYQGSIISSEKIEFKAYHGEFFGPKAIVEKDEFIPFASKLALETYEDIGMSAALQTAQAILETGWGQSIPVDKYTGLLSNNLFGIKGKGTAGSVTSNTWEVYNGITYRIDDNFRAYNDLNESWKDHKALLLNAKRYKPFTEVMYDYTRGAWAIKRAGYATDPNYPIKLINLIYKYDLAQLDKIEI